MNKLLYVSMALIASATAHAVTMKTYTIPAGAHYATSSPIAFYSGTQMNLSFSFDDSANYTTKDPLNQGDINKLAGFSDCSSHHQTNSARFGWRWKNNALEIFAYTYANAVRASKKLGTVALNAIQSGSITVEGSQYKFILNDHAPIYLPRGCSGSIGLSYRLYPYFGGDETAPHTIRLDLAN